MNKALILEWIQLTDERLAALEEAFSVIEASPRAKELYEAELARLDTAEEIERPAADVGELSALFGNKPWLFTAAVLMGRLPRLVEQYRSAGIDDAYLRAMMQDVPRWMRVCEKVHGYSGLAEYSWLVNSFRFRLFEIGSLQFKLSRLPLFEIDDCPGMPVLEVHIPEGADLSPEAVTASMQAAPAFFLRYFGVQPLRFVCESWLLDPALPQILPGSRVALFGQRFIPTHSKPSGQTVERVFGFDVDDYRVCQRETRLQKAVGAWLDAGKICSEGIGYIPIES